MLLVLLKIQNSAMWCSAYPVHHITVLALLVGFLVHICPAEAPGVLIGLDQGEQQLHVPAGEVHHQHISGRAPLVELLLLQAQVLFRHFVFIGLEIEEIR